MTNGPRPHIFECAERNAEAIRTMGVRIIAENRRHGVPSYYMDPKLCAGIVRDMPDGSRQEIALRDGVEVVLRDLPTVPVDPADSGARSSWGGPRSR